MGRDCAAWFIARKYVFANCKMNITVSRLRKTTHSTPGKMSLNGVFQCYTLEPLAAISAGTFLVELVESPRFTARLRSSPAWQGVFGALFPNGRFITPHLRDVPNHSYVEIHIGNFPKDTTGCTLVGEVRAVDFVGHSDAAFIALMNKLTKSAKLVVPQGHAQAAYYELTEPITATYEDCAPFAVTDPELGL